MFEIGNSLREARLRQGIDLARVELDTKIRGRYLQALEQERFEALPADTYVKGFLRTYADYLGLDGQLYVDEFNSRFARADDLPIAPRQAARPRRRASESNLVVVALAAIVAVTVLFVVAWQFGGAAPAGETTPAIVAAPPATAATTGGVSPAAPAGTTTGQAGPATTATTAKPTNVTVVLTAARGDCWLLVRAGSSTGQQLYQGTLEAGQSLTFTRKRVWIQLGAGENLDVQANGEPVESFPSGAAVVLATREGVRTLSSA